MDRRAFIAGSAGGGLLAALGTAPSASAAVRSGASISDYVRSVTAITQVFGTGQKLTAVAVEYSQAASP